MPGFRHAGRMSVIFLPSSQSLARRSHAPVTLYQCRFARPVLANQCMNLSGGEFKRGVTQRVYAGK